MRDGKYLVIYKDCLGLFPVSDNITGKDWTQLKKTATANVPTSDPALTAINTTLESISKCGEERKDLEDMQKLPIDVVNLPDPVKKVYLQQQNKEHFTSYDINKFQNELTEDSATGNQLESNFVCWPKGTYSFLIYRDGTVFQNLLGKIKDQHKYFLQVTDGNQRVECTGILSLYCKIEEQAFQYCIWVPPYMCQNKECASLLGFICDDEFFRFTS